MSAYQSFISLQLWDCSSGGGGVVGFHGIPVYFQTSHLNQMPCVLCDKLSMEKITNTSKKKHEYSVTLMCKYPNVRFFPIKHHTCECVQWPGVRSSYWCVQMLLTSYLHFSPLFCSFHLKPVAETWSYNSLIVTLVLYNPCLFTLAQLIAFLTSTLPDSVLFFQFHSWKWISSLLAWLKSYISLCLIFLANQSRVCICWPRAQSFVACQ